MQNLNNNLDFGVNDFFMPIISNDLDVVSFKIYNRWGDLVFKTNENKAWDGTKNQKLQSEDLYIWHLKAIQKLSNKTYQVQGEVSLIR